MCWRPCVALTLGVGYDAVDTPWHGVPGARLVSREPCTHRLGPLRTPRTDFLADGTRIGDKPRLETCVVSQVVVYTHVGFRLKSAEHMSCVDAKWWKHV